ncbi:MAG: cysteine desulfurase [bacterium]
MEHHANIVPWQMLRDEIGIGLHVVPMSDDGVIDMEAFEAAFNENTKFVSVIHVSNALGTVNPVDQMCAIARAKGVPILVDGCQAAPHMKVDVAALGCDFYAFSGHKMCAPTGSGVLYGRAELLKKMNPFMGGGDMILSVSFEKTRYNEIPHKFEAGTPAIMPVVGLAAAIRYLDSIGLEAIARREEHLTTVAIQAIQGLGGVRVFGPTGHRAPVVSFAIGDVHPHDVGTILDREGVAVRAGHHCAQPLMRRLGVPATARASFAFYNDEADVEALITGIRAVQEIFG